jgi:hypothetical protein
MVHRKAAGDRMATDFSKYYEELRRLKRENPKLGRTMLEHYLRTMYRDELERLNLNATEIYDSYIAEARQISEPAIEPEPHPLLKRTRRT